MAASDQLRVVLDCTVFARALINPKGPAGACVSLALQGEFTLIISEYILREIRELPSKIKPARGVTPDRVEALIQDVMIVAEYWLNAPTTYTHPIDPDDSHYINLAHAGGASWLIANDKHILELRNSATTTGAAFKKDFPKLEIETPEEFIRRFATR